MRAKSILPIFAFFFLFNVVSFAQYQGLSLEQIKNLFSSGPDMTALADKATEFGYRRKGPISDVQTEFTKGSNSFSLRMSEIHIPIYFEKCETREKISGIRNEAIGAGMADLHWPVSNLLVFCDDGFVVIIELYGDGGSITVYPRTAG